MLRLVQAAGSLLVFASLAAQANDSWLAMLAPGESLPSESALPPPSTTQPWHSVTINGKSLTINAVTTARKPTSTTTVRELGPPEPGQEARPLSAQGSEYEPALPPGAAFAFQLLGDAPPKAKAGTYPSALGKPLTLTRGATTSATIAGETWTLSTGVVDRPDGQLLDGSLALFAKSARDAAAILALPASGMPFTKQQLVWAGRLTPQSTLDLLVLRTWPTGEIDYVLSVAGVLGVVTVDPEAPVRAFSSGVENFLATQRPASQLHTGDETITDGVSFTLVDEWNLAYEKAEAAGLPARMIERTLAFRGASVRVTIDYLPLWNDTSSGTSAGPGNFWGGNALVQVTYDGKTQTLIRLGRLDDGVFTFTIGVIDGEVAIGISHMPHYNNQFEYQWVRRASDGRFLRTYVYQSQGC